MLLLFPVFIFSTSLVLQYGRLLRFLHVLVEVQGNFSLEGVPNELIVLIDNFNDFAVEVGKEVRDCWCQHLTLLESLPFVVRPHAFNQLSKIRKLQLV